MFKFRLGGTRNRAPVEEHPPAVPAAAAAGPLPECEGRAGSKSSAASSGSAWTWTSDLDLDADVDAYPSECPTLAHAGDLPEDQRREAVRIQRMSEEDFAKKYKFLGEVQRSGHRGMFVLFATRQSDGSSLVVKALSKHLAFGGDDEELRWRDTMEAQLRMPRSEGICELFEVVETDNRYYVVMEKVDGEDLADTCARQQLDHTAAREVLKQILQAVRVMHGEGRIHKDIKFENIMVSVGVGGEVRAKLIDFDTVEEWPRPKAAPKAATVIGTHGYIAPEGYQGNTSPALDMFAVGAVMYRLLTHRSAFSHDLFDMQQWDTAVGGPSMKKIHKRLRAAKVDFELSPLDACPAAVGLLKSLLAPDPESRPTAEEALQHDWFTLEGELPEQQEQPGQPREQEKRRKARFPLLGKSR